MSTDRSSRNILAAFLLIAALFTAMNRVVASAPFTDWWLPLVLFILGTGLALAPRFGSMGAQPDEEEVPGSGVHTYRVSAQQVPRLQTMTIRPDPDASDTMVTITEDTPNAEGVLPFSETEAVPTTPAPVEVVPSSAGFGTPATAAPPTPPVEPVVEPVVQSPNVPASVVVSEPETPSLAAPEPSVAARTEAVDADVVASNQPAPAPQPDDSVTATPHSVPENEVVAEKMAAPQQPYEAEKVGAITPEQITSITDGSASDADLPVVTESVDTTAGMVEGQIGDVHDFTRIRGIGAKSAAALKAAGIDTFQKLASSSNDDLRAALSSAKVRLVGDVVTWSQQAAFAASGDWDGLRSFNKAGKSADGD